MAKVEINEGYELLQIINDFGEPLEIFREAFQNAFDADAHNVYCHIYQENDFDEEKLFIDIWNDGVPLHKDNIKNFFGLAKSTKIDDKKKPIGKLGYKGHGSKIFFNADTVQICSKTNDDEWYVELDKPLKQIKETNGLEYTEIKQSSATTIHLPTEIKEGFFVRIINPKHFPNKETFHKLDHRYLRDYILWYTIFGTIRTQYDEQYKNRNFTLYLSGLGINEYSDLINNNSLFMDPKPNFESFENVKYEKIDMGHIFPNDRSDKKSMQKYCNAIDPKKNYFDFYANHYYEKKECPGITKFYFYMSLEGYETKRTYDILLSKKGKQSQELKKLTHSDGERYGIWVCKGGIPVEKVDAWYEGGKGTYSYMQAFIDCDDFELTANRGSIRNTKIEIIKAVKEAFNDIMNKADVQKLLEERIEEENKEKLRRSVVDDKNELKKRKDAFGKRKKIILPDGTVFYEPTNTSKYVLSESETMVLLVQLMTKYPTLFNFDLLDYNTRDGIDFVVNNKYGEPKYIELKGILTKSMNHPFEFINKIICYETDLKNGDICKDLVGIEVEFKEAKKQKYKSKDDNDVFNGKEYTGYQLIPVNTNDNVDAIEVICLKDLIKDVLGGEIK